MTVETAEPVAEAVARPEGEWWQRTAVVAGVNAAKRTIDLVVIPYETPTLVAYQQRMVFETIARGAFDGIERRANRVRVNRDHMLARTVGRAVAFHPSREEGLVGEVRIARTDLGDETLALAAEDCLGASAGFLPMDDGMAWQGRDRYTITKAWLRHIALTPEPAYDDARVLAIRTAEQQRAQVPASSTPNLDEARAWRQQDALASRAALLD
jgi:HK97 family phage prohead protease